MGVDVGIWVAVWDGICVGVLVGIAVGVAVNIGSGVAVGVSVDSTSIIAGSVGLGTATTSCPGLTSSALATKAGQWT